MSAELRDSLRDPALLAALERGETLPAAWYTSRALYRREQHRIFRRAWQYVGLIEELANPGDFLTTTLGDLPIVLLRDESGAVRGYANVCRHRGSQLVLAGSGNRKTLQCHYHAWTYNLDGSLRAAPAAKDEPGFDASQFSLFPIQVANWGPFLFVNPDADARPLAAFLGDLPQQVESTGLALNKLHRRVRRSYEIAANWKVVVDNYLECYHCAVAHPSFCDLIDVNNYVVTEYDYFSTQRGATKASARAGKDAGLYEIGSGVEDGFYAYLWPNFTLNIYPGPGNVSLNLFVPVDAGHTLAIYDYCFVDEVEEQQVSDFVKFIDQVQEEDIVLCESVQRGLRSGVFNRGSLMLSREKALRHFQKLVYRALAG